MRRSGMLPTVPAACFTLSVDIVNWQPGTISRLTILITNA